ncbi:hypothetical protein DdX_11432 [Ditylenchus destructor]|uniref:Uncharacterized protein n=1 Tax=Ditylenchus destructor TaxID=166010 RepID=A0AAD4R4H8_9BILA|nr:hypothetical protein DdX_11432 [Ditylenchus destructor]
MILRLHSGGLQDLAEYTRTWMHSTVGNMRVEDYSHRIHHKLATGELELVNISINHFLPPTIRYRPNENSFLYMDTDGGSAEISAKWTLYSKFLSMLGLPLHGSVHGHITGFTSDVAIRVLPVTNQLEMDQCVARFDRFELSLSGSLAADILHWFRESLAKAMQSRIEQTYCALMGERLLPWLRQQLDKFPQKLQFNFGRNVRLVQILHSVHTGADYVELEMRNSLQANPKASMDVFDTLSLLPDEPPHVESARKNRVVELFIDEMTMQELVTAGHRNGLFTSNFTSPFFRTQCDLLCIGKLVPELGRIYGNTSLYAMVRTQDPPLVRLLRKQVQLSVNTSFEIFGVPNNIKQHRYRRTRTPKSTQPIPLSDSLPKFFYGELRSDGSKEELTQSDFESHDSQSPDSRLIPQEKSDNMDWPSALVYPSQQILSRGASEEGDELDVQTQPARSSRMNPGRPLLRIEISAEAEISLSMHNKKVESELKVRNSRAVLREHQMERVEQTTIDKLVDTCIPFVENTMRIILQNGIHINRLFEPHIETHNESMSVEDGYIRLSADLNVQTLLTSL